jgi:hypothetical protein
MGLVSPRLASAYSNSSMSRLLTSFKSLELTGELCISSFSIVVFSQNISSKGVSRSKSYLSILFLLDHQTNYQRQSISQIVSIRAVATILLLRSKLCLFGLPPQRTSK